MAMIIRSKSNEMTTFSVCSQQQCDQLRHTEYRWWCSSRSSVPPGTVSASCNVTQNWHRS